MINKIVPVLTAWKFQKEKIDFLIAVGEKLCNLDANEDTRRLEQPRSCSINEPSSNWDEFSEEYAAIASQIVSKSFVCYLLIHTNAFSFSRLLIKSLRNLMVNKH